ncbi:DoxX family protein [Pleomorphomonas sp. PLEO]|uniref:DoxX family protein n=1 Tax=Pleomorphomonas sp. PLEO TaxID=3239306 RepID=UPI00351E4167
MLDTSVWGPRALAVLRVITALLFLEHATMKFFAFPAGMGMGDGPLPTLIAVAGAIEIIASLMIITGLYARIAAFIASGEMAIAYFMAHAPSSFWPAINKGESAILFCFIFLYIAAAGAGAWSADNVRAAAKAAA